MHIRGRFCPKADNGALAAQLAIGGPSGAQGQKVDTSHLVSLLDEIVEKKKTVSGRVSVPFC